MAVSDLQGGWGPGGLKGMRVVRRESLRGPVYVSLELDPSPQVMRSHGLLGRGGPRLLLLVCLYRAWRMGSAISGVGVGDVLGPHALRSTFCSSWPLAAHCCSTADPKPKHPPVDTCSPDAPATCPPPLQTLLPRICTRPQASPSHPVQPGSLSAPNTPASAQVAEQVTLRETVTPRQACVAGQPGAPEWGVG